MKKIKIFAAVAMFCAAAFAGYTAYDQATMTDAELMMQANLEALTNGGESEDWAGGPDYNSNYGGYYCCNKNIANDYCPYVDCDLY